MLRVPLEAYLSGGEAKVYSFVAKVPYSPVDIDVGRLARGEWNAMTDRFRIWYLPKEDGDPVGQLCYVMVRKFDAEAGVLVYAHVVVNLTHAGGGGGNSSFTVGILCNDDVRARAALNSILDIPPAFHRRDELKPVERRWRADPDAVMRFVANIHSTMAQPREGEAVQRLEFQLPPDIRGEFKRGLAGWWGDGQSETRGAR